MLLLVVRSDQITCASTFALHRCWFIWW